MEQTPDITWGVSTKQQLATIFCVACREILKRDVPLWEAPLAKLDAQATHKCGVKQ